MHSIDKKETFIVEDMKFKLTYTYFKIYAKAIKNESLWLVVPLIL